MGKAESEGLSEYKLRELGYNLSNFVDSTMHSNGNNERFACVSLGKDGVVVYQRRGKPIWIRLKDELMSGVQDYLTKENRSTKAAGDTLSIKIIQLSRAKDNGLEEIVKEGCCFVVNNLFGYKTIRKEDYVADYL